VRTDFPKRPGKVNLIKVTFLPEDVALVMRDDAGRKYVWCRQESPFVQDRDKCQGMFAYIEGCEPGQVATVTSKRVNLDAAPSRQIYTSCQSRHASSLERYIKRGIDSQEVPMVIVAYGFLKEHDKDQSLTSLVKELVYADLVA